MRTLFYAGVLSIVFAAAGSAQGRNWQHLDPQRDSVFGLGTARAYRELLKTPGTPVVVAVIDAGFDLSQPDLAGRWWVNPHETPGNGVDDDHDGYVDDVHGWNFHGSPDSSTGVTGNSDLTGSEPVHGTHVSGIIAAIRNNDIGIDGIVDSVTILPILTDEQNVNDAAAIRYATDHGARVINMSYGRYEAGVNKPVLDSAIQYAMSKNVLIVHAAGNNGLDLDQAGVAFPSRVYDDGGTAPNWIEVGASAWAGGAGIPGVALILPASNYGKTRVDVFAPGVGITSTTPGATYTSLQGTSLAAPMVTGVAALILSRYPQLTAGQVKDILLKSVTKVSRQVLVNDGHGAGKAVPFSETCVSGGIVNAYQALELAAKSAGSGASRRSGSTVGHKKPRA